MYRSRMRETALSDHLPAAAAGACFALLHPGASNASFLQQLHSPGAVFGSSESTMNRISLCTMPSRLCFSARRLDRSSGASAKNSTESFDRTQLPPRCARQGEAGESDDTDWWQRAHSKLRGAATGAAAAGEGGAAAAAGELWAGAGLNADGEPLDGAVALAG